MSDSSLDSGIASSRESSFRNVSVNEESLDDCRESSPGSFTQESLSPVPSFGSEPQTTVSPPTRPEPMAPHLFAVHLTATLGVENALRFAMSSTAENFMAEAQKQTTAMMPKKRARTERKPRENYSKAEQAALEEFYEITKHPQFEEKKELAAKIGLSYQRVQKWFENRRQRDKTIQKARAMVVEV
ncbi:hypothetical protein L596_028502 [Steinernema carpocapsae]|uniref:Homeobox domain-containing protein n=1 Tax=Steinernema carpocapsae TaxID=34508 RepID=A0A4U5LYP4_STECR|nr:hypothetical protein L596_028502 [Steinernema carpocapsae]